MALDIYVGGFARYYALEWENVVQRWARENGQDYQVVGPGGAPHPADWDEVEEAVGHWVAAINQGLGDNIVEPIQWDEARNAPYHTDRLGYEGYGALLVWAAHAELGTIPPKKYTDEWYEDAAFVKCAEPREGQRYLAITSGSLWLPGTFEFSFGFQSMTGHDEHICSNHSLLKALNELNQQTMRLSDQELIDALQEQLDETASLEELAKFGLSLLHTLAVKSVNDHLPIMLDH